MPSPPKRQRIDTSIGPGTFESASLHLFNLPLEVRQNIFRQLLCLEAKDFPEIHFQQAIPFERPVVYIHDVEWIKSLKNNYPNPKANAEKYSSLGHLCYPGIFCYSFIGPCPYGYCGKLQDTDVYWGSAKMSRLLCINRQLNDEILDLIYSQLAFYIVPWNTGNYDFRAWKSWLMSRNPNAIQRICHFQIGIHLDSRADIAQRSNHFGKMDAFTEIRLEDFRDLVETFPSLKSVALQIHFQEAPLVGKEHTYQTHSEKIIFLTKFWRDRQIRTIVFPGPCTGEIGRKIVAMAQEQLQQRQRLPGDEDHTNFQGVPSCPLEKSFKTGGCGINRYCLGRRWEDDEDEDPLPEEELRWDVYMRKFVTRGSPSSYWETTG